MAPAAQCGLAVGRMSRAVWDISFESCNCNEKIYCAASKDKLDCLWLPNFRVQFTFAYVFR